jgi:hypothetical protein
MNRFQFTSNVHQWLGGLGPQNLHQKSSLLPFNIAHQMTFIGRIFNVQNRIKRKEVGIHDLTGHAIN